LICNYTTNAGEVKYSIKYKFDILGTQEKFNFAGCEHPGACAALADGKIYICPTISNIHLFNKAFNQNLNICENDYVDIYKVKSYEELASLLSKPVPFCRYCDVKGRTIHQWKTSNKSIDEYV
jgi:hypothetical protein